MAADMFTRPQPRTSFNLPWGPNHEFQVDGHHYTSLNRSSLPLNVPPYMDIPQSPSPTQLRSHLWSADRYPYLAFLPQFPFVGHWARFTKPVDLIHDRHGWHMPRDAVKSWKNFENVVRANAKCISNYLKAQFSEFIGLWDEPAKPSLYGYFDCQFTEAQARQAIAESVDAFVVYTAYISFLIALYRHYATSLASSSRGLQQLFQKSNLKVHDEWLRDLEDSPIAQFHSDSQRVGSIVNVKSCKWLNLVPFMMEMNVPIWLYWGHPPFLASNDSQISWTSFYTPSSDEAAHSALPAATENPASGPASNFPPVEANSGQLPGETMRAYFQRRRERHRELMQKESALNKQKRLSREKSQAKKQLPGKKGPAVYYWEKTGEFNIRIRTYLSRGLAQSWWTLWPKEAIIYDSFKNQYDCCSVWSFEPDDNASPNPDSDYESSEDGFYDFSKPSTSFNAPHTPVPPEKKAPGSGDLVDNTLSSSSMASPPQIACTHVNMDLTNGVPAHDSAVSLDSFTGYPPVSQADVVLVADNEIRDAPSITPDIALLVSQTDVVLVADNEIRDAPSITPDIALPVSQTDVVMVADSEFRDASSTTPDTALPVSQTDVAMVADNEIRDAPSTMPDIALLVSQTDIVMVIDNEICNTPSATPLGPPVSQVGTNSSEDTDLSADELFAASKQDVLAMHPLMPSVQPPPQPQFLEDLIYYRYGYCLNETTYQGRLPAFAELPDPFQGWTRVCHSVGGQGLSYSAKNHAPITDFLVALLASKEPFHEVPGKYWDLSPANPEPLKLFSPIHLRIVVREFRNGTTLCLLHPHSQPPTTDWYIAVEPMTSLECIRRCLGPCSINIAEFLIKYGIPFRTLAPASNLPLENGPVKPLRQFLGHRSNQHKFDLADFAAYETLRESFIQAQPQGRCALCYGGIVARLARETLPDSVVFTGPSHSALQGKQEIFHDAGDLFVDDRLAEEDLDLICGAYVVETGKGDQTAIRSWFPRANTWEGSGLNVGFWNQECENWYLKRRSDILDGNAVPLSASEWRQQLRRNRKAPQLVFLMNRAALSFLRSSQGDSLTNFHPPA